MFKVKSNKALEAEIGTLNTLIEESKQEQNRLQTELDAANESIVSKDQNIATLTSRVAELEASLEQSNTSLEATKGDLEAQKEATEKAENSSTAKAKDIVAAVGHEEKVTPEEEGPSLVEQYQNTPAGPARMEFRKNHPELFTK